MFLVVISLCIASSLALPSIGYSYSAYSPLSHNYATVSQSYVPLSYSYAPYNSLLTPYTLKNALHPYNVPHVYSAPIPIVEPSVPVASGYHEVSPVKTQYHTQDAYGQASYGHSEAHQSHTATQDAAGNKVGSFSYVKPDGQVHQTNYIADDAGYRVASNDLPVGPSVPAPAVPHILLGSHSLRKRSIHSYAAPVVTPSGHLADTPEVAAAKAAHFAEHVKRGNYHINLQASSYTPYTPYTPYIAPYGVSSYYSPNLYSYGSYAPATPVVTPSGYLADTPEVVAAKAAHFAEKAKVSSHYNAIPVSHSPAYPYITSSGHIADTPEVAAAKAAHFAEHAAANARNAHAAASYPEYSPSSSGHYYEAAPVVTASGHLADTPEVAHARAAHLAEYAAVASRQKRSIILGHPPASTVLLGHEHSVSYVAPLTPYAHTYAHSAVSYPSAYYGFPHLKPVTHTSIIHGPHAVSYRVD